MLVTVTVKVPVGVPPVGLFVSLPHAAKSSRSKVIAPIANLRFILPRAGRRRFHAGAHTTTAGKSNPIANSRVGRWRFAGALMATPGAVVVIVRVTVVGVLVAFTEAGLNVQAVSAGRVPQLNVTAVGNVPWALTFREKVAEFPAVTVAVPFTGLTMIWGVCSGPTIVKG